MHWCFQISKIVSQKIHLSILIHILSWKHLFEIYFRLLRRNNNLLTNIWRNNWRFSFWRCKRTLLKIPLFSVVHFSIMSSLKFKSLIYSKICMCCSTSFQKCTLWHFHEKFVSFSKSPKCVKVYKWLFQTVTLVNYV